MARRIPYLSLLVAVAAIAGASTPESVVRHFAELDAQGARLGPGDSAAVIQRLLTEEAREHEPGWDTALLITGFDVGHADTSRRDSVAVPLTYHVLGSVFPDSATWFHPILRDSTVSVTVVVHGDTMLLAATPGPPAIFPSAATRHFRLLAHQNPRNAVLREALADLDRTRVCEGMPLPVTADEIAGKNVTQLSVMRNEIYARHGRPFKTPWLKQYFSRQKWYHADSAYSDSLVTPAEECRAQVLWLVERSLGDRNE